MVLWDGIVDSESVTAVASVVADIPAIAEFTDPLDVREFTDAATMPAANLRQQLRAHGMPSTNVIGEAFERTVYGRRYEYFINRNRESGLAILAADLGFTFIPLDPAETPGSFGSAWYTNTDGRREGIYLCVSPTPGSRNDVQWAGFVADWVRWMIPHFDVDLSGQPAINVVVCTHETADLVLSVGTDVRQTGIFEFA